MYRLSKTFTAECAHHLPNHDGKCQRVHGHSFRITLVCEGERLESEGSSKGMLLDYGDIKKHGQALVDIYLDHYDLNVTLAPYGITDPTSENIAKWCYDMLVGALPLLTEVTVEETCTSACTYRPSPYLPIP